MMTDVDAIQRVMGRGRVLMLAGLLAVAAIYVLALMFTPPERLQGEAFKIIYVHAPAAWAMETAFVLVGITGALYLWLQDPRLDIFAEASASVGMVFGTVLLITGPIWGKTIWGAWWAWDPRLTFTLLLYLLFAGYFALRSALHDPVDRARFGAIIGIMGTLLVPFIHLTVYLFNSQHPKPVLMKPEKSDLPWILLRPLLASFAAFTLLYIGMVTTRYGIGLKRASLEVPDAG